ncbi:transcriptional regulator XRE [Komagataeibacter europaeus NBRC 3261]|uniref:Transcriptional regulator XRE n=1 Tax=Komagataeibacter europaeus NBRC 3261 TaxID=1234669 RepID=A0A0D6Q111_KOMEU|nr:helix-turn-helix transcriptional regulator [Komagataeibacter europaeus]GAN96680.1 transcriptional regulator XRE [Komagataeibacter europaeus NBRC 3261]
MSDTVGSRLRRLRMTKKLKQADVAEAVGIARPYLSDLESGKKDGSFRTVGALADFFDVSLDYLYRGIEAPFPGAEKHCSPPYTAEEFAMIELWREMDEEQRGLLLGFLAKSVRASVA